MRHKILPFFCFLGLCFSNPVFSQSHGRSFFKSLISPDSLRGFDEQAWSRSAAEEGMYGDEYHHALYYAKRQYIMDKYYPGANEKHWAQTVPPQASSIVAPCINEGFEMGNFSGWTATIGTNTNSCAYPTATTPLAPGALLSIMGTPFVDAITGAVIPNSPLGGSFVAKINNASPTGKVIKLAQTFAVTNANYLYEIAYYAVENGIHTCCQQPYMFVKLRDCIGNLQSCPQFTFNPPATNSASCPGNFPTTWINTGINCGSGACVWRSNGWQKYSIDLTQYIGTCITVEVMVADCSPTAHYMYAYFDSNCGPMNLTVNGSTLVSMPTTSINATAPCGTTATLTAPGGLNPYLWNGPAGSGVTSNTNQTISTAVAGNYTLQMTPVGICNPIFRVINLQFTPPVTITPVPSATVCTNNSATLVATGATNFTWMPGGSNSASLVVTPTATTIYTLTAQAGTCIGTFTRQITVNPSPTVNISSSSSSVCSGGPSTLTASGATSYTWSTGATGSVIVVTPTTNTTYSVTGSTGAACNATASINVGVVPTPTNMVTVATPSYICSGATSNLFGSAVGATSYSWFPGPLIGNFVSVTPTATTIYTLIAANGSCTNSAQVTVSVSSGPTLNLVASPTSICPGGSSTLSASGAVSYTWNPGGTISSSVVVSPGVTTTYSVTGVDVIGCTKTSTVSLVVSPVPNITITPVTASICIGSVASLTASGASTYTWNPGSLTGSVVAVSPTTSTTYTIVGSNGTCTNSATKLLTVVPIPTVSASSSTNAICSGSSLTLTGSGATTYTWMPGSLTGSNVTVSPTITTTYTLTGSSAACSSTATTMITVYNGPTITATPNPTAVCQGNSSTITATGAVSYTWMPGAMTTSAVTVSPSSTQIYTITGINVTGCIGTRTVSLLVNPNPTVNITGTSTVCIGSAATMTANGATTYTWMPGSLTGANVTVTPASTQIYTVTGSNGTCTSTANYTVNVVPVPTVGASSSTNIICSGSSATLTGSGATTYTWMPGSLTGLNVTVSPTITTTYTVTGSSGACTGSTTIMITVNNGPTITATPSPTAICPGGSSTITANGAASYTWMPGAMTTSAVTVSPVATQIYTITGINATGCTKTQTVSLLVNPNPTINITGTSTVCIGSSATMTATGASSGYTWMPGSLTGANVTVTLMSTQAYTVTGSNGTCTNTANFTVNVVPIPTVGASSSTNIICTGSSATLTGSGATTYTWMPGSLTGVNVTVSPTLTTTYTITGSSGACTGSTTIMITVDNGPTITATPSPTAICPGGSSTITANGAASYTWMPGAMTTSAVTVSPVATQIYTITGINSTGCAKTQTVSLLVNPNPTVNASSSSPSICVGSSATLTASGATTYTWLPGAMTGSSTVVTPTTTTTYTVTGSTLGCTGSNTVILNIVPVPTVIAVSNPTAICIGSSATLTASGATTYTWMPGSMTGTSAIVSPTITTTYTVTGNNGSCSSPATVALVVNPLPTVTPVANPTAICVSGNVTLTATGASTYTWMPGAMTGSSTVVSPVVTTTYIATGTSTAGCTNTAAITVTVNAVPVLTLASTPTAVCMGSSSTLTALGATNYTWMPGAMTGSSTVVSPTITTQYTVTGVTGACSSTQTVNLIVNPNPTVTASSSPTNICVGSSATLTANGAATYTWLPGSMTGSSAVVSPTATTIYTVTGSTALGCTNTTTVNLMVTPLPTVNATASPTAICIGNTSTLTATGAASYTWMPGSMTGSSTVVSPTTNTQYTVTGMSGICSTTQTVNLIVNPLPTVTASASAPTICVGQSTSLTAGGASTFTWLPGPLTGSTVVVSPTINTTYTVTGTSTAGCVNTETVAIVVNPLPTLTVSATATNICSGGSTTLTGAGGVSYFWNPGGIPGSPISVTPTVTTTYTLFGTSGAGCVNTATITVSVTPVPTITALSNPTAICIGNSATLTASGASNYTWNPGAMTGSSTVVSPTINTTYTISGATGICNSTQTVAVVVNPLPTLTTTATQPTICAGMSSTLTGTGAATYTWMPGTLTGSNVVVTPTITTTYTATGTSSLGCTNTKTVTVTVNPLPTLTITSTATNICAGSSATLTGSGASTYSWNPGASAGSTVAVTPTISTQYTLTGTSAAGCTNTATFNLSVTPVPTVNAVSNPTAICVGGSATLTATGASNYTWTPGPSTGSNVVVTPAITTTYTVIGAIGICNNTQTVSVVVNPLPTLTASASSPTICIGTTTSLTANGAATYTWNPGTLTGSTVPVTPTITTTYTVVGTSSLGCSNNTTVIVTVNPLPTLTITSTATNICSSTSATLTGTGAVNYTWMPGATTGSTAVISPTATSVYTLTGASAAGCTNTASYTLNVTPTPTLSVAASSTMFCSGGSASITVTGATSYTWNPGASTGSNVVVTPTATTQYTVTGVNGICSSTAAITISVNPTPTVTVVSNPTVLCSGQTATLTASGAANYTWMPVAAISSTIIDNPTVNTTYTVYAISAAGCTNTALFTLTVNTTPTVTAIANPTAICSGSSATLTASGATNYTWSPGALTGSNVVVTPTTTTNYTVNGLNGTCNGNTVVTVVVNSLPTLTASASPTVICAGATVSLTAAGASTYTWIPVGSTGSAVVHSPIANTTYSVIGTNTNGCNGQATVSVLVNPNPTVVPVATPTSICLGSTGTLSVSGASTYTWLPGGVSATAIAVNPTVTTTYTVTGTDVTGCTDTETITMVVLPSPTVTASSSPTALCSGNSATLTAGGASTYTWMPGTITTSVAVVNPTSTTVYTLTGSNGICGSGIVTLTLVVNPLPNVTTGVSGSITCSSPSVTLLGSSTPTSVNYLWNGPGGYTSTVGSPTGIAVPGDYTLTATEITSGCSSSNTVTVLTDTSIPTVTATATGTITCSNASATITAATSATNAGYMWSGPGSFTSAVQTNTVSLAGTYTVTVIDLSSSCPASTVVTVISDTNVPITATIVPATCSGTMANNNGAIYANGHNGITDKYDLVAGSSYTGSATYATAVLIPGATGLLISTLPNPLVTTPYTVRFFSANGCVKDTTLFLTPTSCITNTVFGIAKAVSSPTVKPDGTYDVDYFVVVKNTGTQQLDNIALVENLAATFPAPTVFSVVSAPVVTSINSSITINPAFDGSVQTMMTNTTSVLAAGKTDTIQFRVNIKHNGNFGPFNNTVIGFSSPTVGVVFADSSNTGYDPDPDANGNPTDNNIPTPLNLTPNLFFGLTKTAELGEKLDNNTWDITYTITVHNLGNDTLKNVVVKDSLFNNTIKQPASYTIKSGPFTTGSLTANAGFNGNSDINLLVPSQSKIAPGQVNTIIFTINVDPDTITVVKNSAFGTAMNTTSITVSDTSNAGTNPDTNNNGVWNEAADNVPTVLSIPNSTLFVPQGFSPDGDGKNDFWVIKGLSSTENTLTIYNRWGNKVYRKENYDNTWNGYPNVSGTLGNEKLPAGTYYYILEFKSGDQKPLNGFVVLQY